MLPPRSVVPWTLVGAMLAPSASAQVTQRVNVSSRGAEAHRPNSYEWLGVPGKSTPDGRTIVFATGAANLVPGDTNETYDIFVRDRQSGTTERVSVGQGGVQADDDCTGFSITPDGRYAAFTSFADNLVPNDTNGALDVFVRDRSLGTTERVSVASGGLQGNYESQGAEISADGRYVAFGSYATNLVPGDTNGYFDFFVHDRRTGITERVSVDSNGGQADVHFIDQFDFAMSSDGRFVAFVSDAVNLVPGDSNESPDVFVRDRLLGTTERVSVASNGAQQEYDWGWEYQGCSISADGRFVGFISPVENLVPRDTNEAVDAFVHDRLTGRTERVSVSSGGAQSNAGCWTPYLSADGRFVSFASWATNLVTSDTNDAADVFLRDRLAGTTECVSVTSAGAQSNGDSSYPGSITPDGRFVVFTSVANNLVPHDTNGAWDAFVRDRTGGTSFSIACEPNTGSVVACPCSNPPAGPGQGCDNRSGTGGATLSASGGTFLSSDSLVFRTSGENPTALSMLIQGTAAIPSGSVYGRGVRCARGTITRLFTKDAVAGQIVAPDSDADDPQLSVRSASKGNLIRAGEVRWYVVVYRDRVPRGTCGSTVPFNATPTGVVTWSP